jgi:tetratricopeptide (TPR) repeat protein
VIFISYRRGDSEGQAGRLFERLRREFGGDRVFMDVTDIDPGKDFRLEIERAIGTCDLLLVIIGQEWLHCETPTGERRLDQAEDWVRLEVAAALRRNIPVIPVLVEDASMPGFRDLPDDLRPLAERNAAELRHVHWDRDEAALIQQLSKLVSRQQPRIPRRLAVAALVVTLAAWAAWTFLPRPQPSGPLTVLVADFDGPDQKGLDVRAKVLQKLSEATRGYSKVRIVPLNRTITEADGSAVASAEGRKGGAAVVIWGWYRTTRTTVLLSANFELLKAPQYMPAFGPLTRSRAESRVADLDWKAEVTELENFALQTTLSDELAYLTLVTLGMVQYVAEDWGTAIEHFTGALTLTADQASKVLGHDAIYYKRGFSYGALDKFDEAIADYTRAITIDKDNAKFWSARGAARLQKNDVDAVADFDRAVALKPDDALAYQNRAAAYSAKGDLRRAIEDYDRAIARNPRDPYFFQHRARAYEALGDHDRAIADYGEAVKLKPDETVYYREAFDSARTYYERAASYSAKGDHQGAIDNLTEAIKSKPSFWLAFHDRGLAYRSKGEAAAAIDDFNQAILLQPSDSSAYNNRGNAYSDLGRVDDAIADFGRAIEREPKSAAAHNNRGIAYKAKGDLTRAFADYDQAIRLDPTFALAYDNRCIAYVGAGHFDRAIADCDEAIRLAPEDPLPYNDRGFAYFKKGDFDRAIADYDAAIKLKPDYGLARRNRQEALQARVKAGRGSL